MNDIDLESRSVSGLYVYGLCVCIWADFIFDCCMVFHNVNVP